MPRIIPSLSSGLYRRLTWLICILPIACASPNEDAPLSGNLHVQDYLATHAADALLDLNRCVVCHRDDFKGTGPETDCTLCHKSAPIFDLHEMPYTAAELHGPAAGEDLWGCFGCHGTSPNLFDGGIVADPDAFDASSGNCSSASCHPAAGAHPTRWQGDNDITEDYLSSHRSTNNQATNCAVCHDYTQGRTAPNSQAPSCFSAGFTNADGAATSCHPKGPGTNAHELPFADAQSHGVEAKADLAACQLCHGIQGSTLFNGGIAPTSCSTASCHPDAGAHPTRWQGGNDISGDYLSSHRTAGNQDNSCALCHDYTQGRTAPDSRAPSCFSTDFTNADGFATGCHPGGGGSAPHDLPYTSPQAHGDDAKSDLSACQACHGTEGTLLFNGGTASTSCATASCHPAAAAHPTRWQGSNDNTSSYISSHRDSHSRSVSCSICHDYTSGRTAPNPNAPSCYTSSFTNADGVTSECHD